MEMNQKQKSEAFDKLISAMITGAGVTCFASNQFEEGVSFELGGNGDFDQDENAIRFDIDFENAEQGKAELEQVFAEALGQLKTR